MTNLDSILKSKDITLPTKVHLVKAMVFPIVMYRCESWTIKKAEHQRMDAFNLLEKTFVSRLNSKEFQLVHPKGNQSWAFTGSWNANTLATWCKEPTHWKRLWCWERLKVGGKGGIREWVGWMASSSQWTWVWVNSGSWWWTGRPGMLQLMASQRVGHDWVTELNWTTEKF